MSASNVFLDTNILVYSFDSHEPEKRERALAALERLPHRVLSTQVLLELYNVLTRKLKDTAAGQIADEIIEHLSFQTVIPADARLVNQAVQIAGRFHISIWDAMIVAAAKRGGCKEIWSEDLSEGMVFDGVTVVNPLQ